MAHTAHRILEVALLIPFLVLSLGVILTTFGIAWQARSPKGRR